MNLASSTMDVGHRVTSSAGYGAHRARKPAFYLVTAAFLAFLVFALRDTMAMVVNAWFAGYAFPDHRVHHVMIGGTLAVFVATVAIQLYRPSKRVGALQAAIAFVIAAFALTILASGPAAAGEILVFVVPVLLIAALHPARRQLVPSLERVDVRLLALAAVGAIGFGTVAVGEYAAHTTLGNEHVVFGHYEFMLIALASIGLFAILGALRPIGWRALVYGAGALAILFAVGSLAFPGIEQGSSLGPIAALAVIAWAVAFVGLAEYTRGADAESSPRDTDTDPSRRESDRETSQSGARQVS
ncbi:hypothetical protein [Halovivax sp.]|uniref:hypothetical protein n=1 Tax=Halovivax sp. TaxID=1935978 RepID=UPI0025BA7AC5|nr:hypothetical protein [Halovivax sp.]